MTTNLPAPKRGEVWRVNLDPTIGAEIRKTRPAVVLSSNSVGRLPLKPIAPVTEWQEPFEHDVWHVQLQPSVESGLTKLSAVDVLQCRGVDVGRFLERIGVLPAEAIRRIVVAVAALIEYSHEP